VGSFAFNALAVLSYDHYHCGFRGCKKVHYPLKRKPIFRCHFRLVVAEDVSEISVLGSVPGRCSILLFALVFVVLQT